MVRRLYKTSEGEETCDPEFASYDSIGIHCSLGVDDLLLMIPVDIALPYTKHDKKHLENSRRRNRPRHEKRHGQPHTTRHEGVHLFKTPGRRENCYAKKQFVALEATRGR